MRDISCGGYIKNAVREWNEIPLFTYVFHWLGWSGCSRHYSFDVNGNVVLKLLFSLMCVQFIGLLLIILLSLHRFVDNFVCKSSFPLPVLRWLVIFGKRLLTEIRICIRKIRFNFEITFLSDLICIKFVC